MASSVNEARSGESSTNRNGNRMGSRMGAKAGEEKPFFRIRLINIDHVLTRPGIFDRTECAFNSPGQPLRRVPVVRVFGATPAGQRVCAHFHGVFPYCYVEFKGSLEPDQVLKFIHRLGRELNTAIAASLRRDPYHPDQSQFIAAIHLCKGVPFYGYHVGWKYFLKISFVDPAMNVRIATILQSGKVMGMQLQPYEVHIRYQLQFMLDHNLFGCDYIDLRRLFFRRPLPQGDPYKSQDSSDLDEQRKQWNEETIPNSMKQDDAVSRNSYCELEVDVHCADILNRASLRPREMHMNFDERDEMEGTEKLVPSLTGLWEEEQARRVHAGLNPTVPKPDTLGDERCLGPGKAPKWLAENRLRSAFSARLEVERQRMKPDERYASTFCQTHTYDSHIVTTFESVDILHGTYTGAPSTSTSDRYDLEAQAPRVQRNVYDLEASLSQSTGNSPAKSEDGDMAVDEAFFHSQHFQNDMIAAETQLRHGERADDDSGGEEEIARVKEKEKEVEEELPNTPTTSRTSTPFLTPSRNSHGKMTPNKSAVMFSSPLKPQREKTHSNESVPEDWRSRTKSGEETPRVLTKAGTTGEGTGRVRFAAGQEDDRGIKYSGGSSKSSLLHSSQSNKTNKSSDGESEQKQARRGRRWKYAKGAPMVEEINRSFPFFGLPIVEHKDPYFSNAADVPKAREYAGRTFVFASTSLAYLGDFETGVPVVESGTESPLFRKWGYSKAPPSRLDVQAWQSEEEAQSKRRSRHRRRRLLSQRVSVTQPRDFGFQLSQREHTSLVDRSKQHMTILGIELLTCGRGQLHPDPAVDSITAILYSFQHEDERLEDTGSRPGLRTGVILVSEPEAPVNPSRLGLSHLAVEVVNSELELINALIDLVRTYDPEILIGWEIHSSSWGYVVERASREYEYEVVPELGRVNGLSTGSKHDHYGATQTSALRITGRHVLNLWRMMRSELTLNQYTYENVVFHLLRRRVPKFSFFTLTSWFKSGRPEAQTKALRYWIERVETDLEIIEASELVFRTSEFARIYGVDFFSVISRGSQFKVESVLFRIAKPESFVLPSPSQEQVGKQNAAEDLPLVMEPQSAFYKGPLLVLDFQSLYPSMMIAYNICYSTCLGRVSQFRNSWKLGYTEYAPPRGLLTMLKDDCFISPNGLLYVKPNVRKSLLSKMLTEILDTRVMVKGSTKGHKGDKSFMRLQNARQLSLKLLANVTYGYTSATFSGRMPCVEIADSIVRYGRETLEKAIELIHRRGEWGAQVVYGDTDSLFIYLENRTREEAFQIGNAIADAVTAQNPAPVKLKFEKVYLPSVLLAKKRYVGFMCETPEDKEPTFNAKGIETVRRDGFPAQQRMVEACIRILFRTRDLSLVKAYCQRQWRKILEGKALIQDFIIAKEVKLGSYSENGVPPPGAALSARRMLLDKRSKPQYGERVPYLIRQGEPKSRLIDLAVSPEQMLQDPTCQLHAIYYITRGLIPPLSRIFNLLGADVESWFKEMPRVVNPLPFAAILGRIEGSRTTTTASKEHPSTPPLPQQQQQVRSTLISHYRSEHCRVCGRRSDQEICIDCGENKITTTIKLANELHSIQERRMTIEKICSSCSRFESPNSDPPCISTDCPIIYEKVTTKNKGEVAQTLLEKWEEQMGW